jgi:phosphatidylserine decarboxylase
VSSALDTVIAPINKAGWPFIGIFAAVAALLFRFAPEPFGWAGVVLTLWCAYFFRDPARVTPERDGLVISPADGTVQLIDEAAPPPELGMGEGKLPRVCVFMNVFNVHVNRIPAHGVVKDIAYHPGKFLNASLDKASEMNERNSLRITTEEGPDIAVVQIAGLVARRIKCDAVEGQVMRAGERFGLIRFGSRLDVYLPEGTAPQVIVGQTAVAGETVLADLRSPEEARHGTMR